MVSESRPSRRWFNLIDGLRRLRAHQEEGKSTIEAFMSWTREESIE